MRGRGLDGGEGTVAEGCKERPSACACIAICCCALSSCRFASSRSTRSRASSATRSAAGSSAAPPPPAAAPPSAGKPLPDKDPALLRDQYKEYLSTCVRQERKPEAAVVECAACEGARTGPRSEP